VWINRPGSNPPARAGGKGATQRRNVTCWAALGKWRFGRRRLAAPATAAGFAHVLWIRLCASQLTLGKTVDFKGEFRCAQKDGKNPIVVCAASNNPPHSTLVEFCTFSVDKIVRNAINA
jgi:hypothetical protein